jgi:ABC-type uncharacterized transport system involved in gliding motility auxiliary subunit
MSDTKKKRGVFSFLQGKRFRHGGYAVILTVLFIAIVVVLNVAVDAAETKWGLRIDATSNQLTSFSEQTYTVLDSIAQDVNIYLVYQPDVKNDRRVQLEEIVNKYQARNDHIKTGAIDPMREPNRINKYAETDATKTMSNGSIIVTNADETRVKLITANDLNAYGVNQQDGSYYIAGFNGESRLTTALMYVTSETTPIVYFLTGHEEYGIDKSAILKTQLQSENYDAAELTLGPDTALKPGDTVLINVPRKDLMDEEYEILKNFLNGGGRMMFVDEFTIDFDKLPNFKRLLDYYSISFERGIVVEDLSATSKWRMDPTYLIPTMDAEDDITAPLANAGRVLLPMSAAIKSPDLPLSGYRYTNLLTSSDQSYFKDATSETVTSERAEGDATGPFTLAMSIYHQADVDDATKDTRIVLLASPYATVDNSFIYETVNLDFTMNAFDWLSNREVSVYIRAKANANTVLNIPDAGTMWMLAAIVVVVIPVLVLIVGVVVYVRRRRL